MPCRTRCASAWLGLSVLLVASSALLPAGRLHAQAVRSRDAAAVDPSHAEIAPGTPQCDYSLSATSIAAPAEGGRFAVNVVTRPGCDWAVVGTLPWVTLSVVQGVGRGAVLMEIHPNTSTSSRSGAVAIAGQTVTVQQDGAPACSLSVSPTYISLPVEGGRREVSVTVREGCAWTVVSDEDWVVPSVTAGTGSGTFSLRADANGEKMRRTATLAIGSGTIWVSQSGRPR